LDNTRIKLCKFHSRDAFMACLDVMGQKSWGDQYISGPRPSWRWGPVPMVVAPMTMLFSRLQLLPKWCIYGAWWGFASALSAADRGRSEAFLRRSTMFGYRDATAPSLACICAQADDKLLKNMMNMLCNARHLLHIFLPERSHHYSFRDCPHNRRLPNHTSALNNNDFN
jgi:hypothetical protein